MKTCRNRNVLVVNRDIYVETCMNVIGKHEKADLLMCTVKANNCLKKHDGSNTMVPKHYFFLRK